MMRRYPSSSSSTTVSQCYDVFMSFRGKDTRMTFTSHLYDALIQNGIRTYKDDMTLELGKPIAPELIQAIEASKIAVVILSRQYATSKWCLQELAEIVDCMKLGMLTVIPIFYHVTPCDVRHQSNCFEQAFSNHDANTQIAPGTVNMWRAAFKEVGALAGMHVTKDKDEAEVVRTVVSRVLSYLSNTMPLDGPIERSRSAATAVYAASSAAATYGERSAATAVSAASSAAPQWPYTLHQAQPPHAVSAATTAYRAQSQRAPQGSQLQHRHSERSHSATSSAAAAAAVSSEVGASAAAAIINEVMDELLYY
ncbi:putative TIR domain-containing protein [Helianthus annuus]|nr:putative TIR domain-containing protein [Helianthus annuus]KAJ0789562.1 putative TIR domain-containing protein [Helianthus annuus]